MKNTIHFSHKTNIATKKNSITKSIRTYSRILLGSLIINACNPRAHCQTPPIPSEIIITNNNWKTLQEWDTKNSQTHDSLEEFSKIHENISKQEITKEETIKNLEIEKKDLWKDCEKNKASENLQKHKIALTFDDGPSPYTTPLLLKILKEHNVKATFFMVWEMVDRNCDIAKQIVSEWHEVWSHSQTH